MTPAHNHASNNRFAGRNDYLKRLDAKAYRGHTYVHWSMTIEDRRTGWLNNETHCEFREILTHTSFRYAICCPVYCCMPDHVHLLWMGLLDESDQRRAARYFRKHFNAVIERSGFRLQQQPYDRVLRDDDRETSAFETAAEYILRNPERAGLVPVDGFRTYPYNGCLIPGYPEVTIEQRDYWDRLWRTYSHLRSHGLFCGARDT